MHDEGAWVVAAERDEQTKQRASGATGTQSSGGDLTVFAVFSMAVGNHGMGAMEEKGLKAGLC